MTAHEIGIRVVKLEALVINIRKREREERASLEEREKEERKREASSDFFQPCLLLSEEELREA